MSDIQLIEKVLYLLKHNCVSGEGCSDRVMYKIREGLHAVGLCYMIMTISGDDEQVARIIEELYDMATELNITSEAFHNHWFPSNLTGRELRIQLCEEYMERHSKKQTA
jgi:hypothetical protein